MKRFKLLAPIALVVVALLPRPALGHAERPTEFPDGKGSVPEYRTTGPLILVCNGSTPRGTPLRRECRKDGYPTIQGAIDHVTEAGSRIKILPGTYAERPSRKPSSKTCKAFEEQQILSYREHQMCPHVQNLIAILGDGNDEDAKCDGRLCNLQIEGTGRRAEDVVIRGGFTKKGEWARLNGIRGDRANGLYLKNFTVELFEFNSIYILETDGFVVDDVVTRYNDEYGFLTFAVDHGLYKNCEAYGNGDAGLYPGSASDVNSDSTETGPLKRWAIEIENCRSHHNALGYSGTAGNSVYAHDNRFFKNQAGIATDSIYPNHPGLPQDHAWFEDNKIYSNNQNYTEKYVQSGICDRKPSKVGYEKGAVCTAPPAPVGVGMVIAGGNHDYLAKNEVWDNWRAGFMLIGVPAAIRNEMDPSKQFDTSNFNAYVGNNMGIAPSGKKLANGLDFWWDDQGEGNCWKGNRSGAGEPTDNTLYPGGLPNCDDGGSMGMPANPAKQGPIAPCALYNRDDAFWRDPPVCPWFDSPEKP